eukprot:TRINITY_DN5723_c0_g1_i1.p1 TRINITY_DN5723_c0_g1~~TRINITY_DN5723_c0_g1_i1.p1  ORF type:complete len:943 (+),score=365.69 TRINITY_DN5723_c0_g1_i1:95-2923(+)
MQEDSGASPLVLPDASGPPRRGPAFHGQIRWQDLQSGLHRPQKTAKLRALAAGPRRRRSRGDAAAPCPAAGRGPVPAPRALPPAADFALCHPDPRRFVQEYRSEEQTAAELEEILERVAAGSQSDHPKLRTAAAFCLLQRIARSVPRFGDTLGKVLEELERCVYVDPGECEEKNEGGSPADGAAVKSAESALATAFASESTPLSRLLARPTYRERFASVEKQWATFENRVTQLDAILAVKTKVLNTAVINWQRSFIWRVFHAWRESIKREKVTRRHMRDTCMLLRRRDQLHAHLCAWRVYTTQRKVARDWLQVNENLILLEQNKAVAEQHIAELSERYDELRVQMITNRDAAAGERERTMVLERMQERTRYRMGEWQGLARAVLSFLSGLRERQSGLSLNMTRAAMPHTAAQWHETTTRVLLGWVNGRLREVPHRLARKGLAVYNFSGDWRSGDAYLLLLSTISQDDAEELLGAVDALDNREKLEKAVDFLQRLGCDHGIQAAEIQQGIPDYNIVSIHSLWRTQLREQAIEEEERLSQESESDAVGLNAGDCAAARKEFREQSEAYLQQAADAQAIEHYILFLVTSRAHGTPFRVLSKMEEKDALRELQSYASIQVEQLPEMFVLKLAKTPEEQEARERQNQSDLSDLVDVVTRNFVHIRRAFRHYCGVEAEAAPGVRAKQPSMDFSQFWHFCSECRLIDQAFTKAHAAALFADVNMRNRGSGVLGKDDPQAFNPDHLLTPSEFVQVLLRMAVLKYAPAKRLRGEGVFSHVSAFEHLLHQDVIPRAGMAAVDATDFRLQMWSEAVQGVLRRQRGRLLKLYRHYAQKERSLTMGSDSSLAGHHTHTMHVTELRKMFSEAQILGPRLSSDDLELFVQKQDDGMMDDQLVFSEFEQVLVCVAATVNPNPFDPLHGKVQHFLDQVLFPSLTRYCHDLGKPTRRAKR